MVSSARQKTKLTYISLASLWAQVLQVRTRQGKALLITHALLIRA
jgi:hypothetical protein